jgi:hypothetical protein
MFDKVRLGSIGLCIETPKSLADTSRSAGLPRLSSPARRDNVELSSVCSHTSPR